jgi:soluble lytic murein transglycosylase-like protein
MRRPGSIILGVLAALLLGATPPLAAPRQAADGSLVLEGGGKEKKTAASGDTLYELLGREVQVYIFNNKVRVWPQAHLRSYVYPWGKSANPQVEALISKYSLAYGVDPALVRAVMRHESGFNSRAVSPKGAQGLMQLMPGTAALMGVTNPFDPEQNVAGGVGYLRFCLDRFGHNVPLAVAAYNAGPENVAKYCSVPPFAETQAFVHNVVGAYSAQKGAAPAKKGAAAKAARPHSAPGKAAGKEKAPETKRSRPKVIEVRSSKPKPGQTQPN